MARRPAPTRRRRLRLLYFMLASVWGYVAGTAAVLGTLSMLGQPVQLRGTLVSALVFAAVVSLVGGLVAALAYREAVRRG